MDPWEISCQWEWLGEWEGNGMAGGMSLTTPEIRGWENATSFGLLLAAIWCNMLLGDISLCHHRWINICINRK